MKNIFMLTALTLFANSCSDVVSSHYVDYQGAVEARLFERGWLPSILPESTTDIETHNDVARNASHGQFRIPDNEIERFLSQLHRKSDDGYVYKNTWTFVMQQDGLVRYRLGY